VSEDPRDTLARCPMTRAQILIVAITVGLNALDGFDVLAISFASPGIARDWGINRAALGIVLSMELIGMAFGSMLLGSVADRVGRRQTVLGCLLVMTLGMALATTAHGVVDLSIWRVITGLGIGGMLAAINAVAAEFSNARRRDLCVSLMAIGYPLGAITGGSVAALLLEHSGWRAVFAFGAATTGLLIPIVLWLVPESVNWLCQKQPADALARLNRSLAQIGHAVVAALPPPAPQPRHRSLVAIFEPGFASTTLLVTLAYFLHITTFYFIVKWIPKIVVDMGFAPSAAAGVLVWANVGGATGGAMLGLLTQRLGLKPLTIALLIGSTAMVVVFGRGQVELQQLSLICALTGFCTNGAIVGIYAILARAFPTQLRATGTGFAVGTGRGGAVLAPILAGYLFQTGFGLQFVAIAMSSGSLLAAVAIALLAVKPPEVAAVE
jgi:benzoate transport